MLHHNQPIYSVSEISARIKRTIDDGFSYIRVRGEISGLKLSPSGHIYFSLKDDKAVLASVCWKNVYNNLSVLPEDGLEVICIGAITTYPGQSKYQLVVTQIEVAGTGALMALFLKRKEQLEKEGLFDTNKKKVLPKYPEIIGVVTSPTGAVIKDILHRLQERFPIRVILWPVLVQGVQAAEQIAGAINGFNNFTDNRPDVLIVARGGGSIEDLWAFNEEIVVRAASSSQIPLISAVGHETDVTLIDYASSLRAPTPTAAAEIAVPVKAELLLTLDEKARYLYYTIIRFISHERKSLEILAKSIPNYAWILTNMYQTLDDLSTKLIASLPRIMEIKNMSLNNSISRLRNPKDIIINAYNNLLFKSDMLKQCIVTTMQNKQHKLNMLVSVFKPKLIQGEIEQKKLLFLSIATQLIGYNHKNILKRGFAIIRNEEGNIIKSVRDLEKEKSISIELEDGKYQISK
ncbi:Exodeoxyribonuclease 7 large subunit [Rickettsiales bacterium Ac37b]|nr:Exodeoxyribonuclease 7 large subunit [Rickettsiales bacterium Ac37b]